MNATLQIILGLLCLAGGGDILVRGAVGIARKLRVSPLLTGLLLVGFGTSTPELVTSVNAILKDSPAIAVGNVLGSNIANILFILGLAALITPLAADRKALKRDGPMMALAALACLFVTQFWAFGRLTGAVFVAILAAYVSYVYRVERRVYDAQAALHQAEAELLPRSSHALWVDLLFAAGGIVLLIFGANVLVDGALVTARAMGISELVIGLTIVAVGTSLPELATSVAAALKKHFDIAIGNIVGSNIFNIFGILGVTALVRPFDVPEATVRVDVWIMVAVTALLLAAIWRGGRLGRATGLGFMLLYGVYIALLMLR